VLKQEFKATFMRRLLVELFVFFVCFCSIFQSLPGWINKAGRWPSVNHWFQAERCIPILYTKETEVTKNFFLRPSLDKPVRPRYPCVELRTDAD